MAAPSSSAAIGGAIRDTDEYAAAFDLELWKAQQQLRYQAQLRQAKENLERRLRTQMREAEQRRLAELEALRQELETMGQRLQLEEETLVKRSAQLDARESTFNAKRVKVTEEHEAYVVGAEERERRTREEAQLTQSILNARLQEKDEAIAQLQARLSAAQQEYELLHRRTARHLTEQADTDGQRVREQECALALAHAQLAEAQRQLRDKAAEAERLAEDKAQLQHQLQAVARQLSAVTRKYHRATEENQTREWERLRREQDALEAAKQAQTLRTNRKPIAPASSFCFSLSPRDAAPYGPSAFGAGTVQRGKGNDGFYDMLTALKQEVAAGLADVARDSDRDNRCGALEHALPFKIVERPPSVAATRLPNQQLERGQQSIPVSNSNPLVSAPETAAGEKAAVESTQFAESEIAKEEMSSVSAALSAIPNVQASPPQTSSSASPNAAFRPPHHTNGGDVVVDMGDTSMESCYPHAELPPSWSDSLRREGEDTHPVAPLPPARVGTLPPLAPELRGSYADDDNNTVAGGGAAGGTPASRLHVSPTPEEFVLAREAPLADATSNSEVARREMRGFVEQLKMNREKLLETGVYSAQDCVVREMGEKIHMYEEYLAQHS